VDRRDDGQVELQLKSPGLPYGVVTYGAETYVRTGGPSDPYAEVHELARVDEKIERQIWRWEDLATVRGRALRAELLLEIAENVTGPLGAAAAEHLACVARSEQWLACAAEGHPHPSRWVSKGQVDAFGWGGVLVCLTVLWGAGLSTWAKAAISGCLVAVGYLAVRGLSWLAREHAASSKHGGQVGGSAALCIGGQWCGPLTCRCGQCPVRISWRRRRRGRARQVSESR